MYSKNNKASEKSGAFIFGHSYSSRRYVTERSVGFITITAHQLQLSTVLNRPIG
jgi:hypothetical protein